MASSPKKEKAVPDHTAERVALWRALHVQLDAAPHILNDEIGLKLIAPSEGWRRRPDMHPGGTRTFRASIVARARFVEELVLGRIAQGIDQYVILGAGLDSFAQRHADTLERLKVFEIDQPETQVWKKKRLSELGFAVPENLKFVPTDFEKPSSWLDALRRAGFERNHPTVVSSTGVAMYLTQEAIETQLRQLAAFAPGSTLAMSFLIPVDLMAPEERQGFAAAEKGARARGTPFLSFFAPDDIRKLALTAGFKTVETISGFDLAKRYFAHRSDGLRPSNSEQLIVATT